MADIDRTTKINAGFALTLIVVIVAAAMNVSGQIYGLRLELAKDYATKQDVVKLRDSLTAHRGAPGHEPILERVRRLEKIHDPK